MLPKLPNIPEKVKPRPHFAFVCVEPIVPKMNKKTFDLLTDSQKKKAQKDAEEDVYNRSLQKGNMRRAIVMVLPNDVDAKKFPMQVGDVVSLPFGEYHTINIDKTLVYMVGIYDLSVLPDLTEEEVKEWDENQERYRNEIMYPVEPDTSVHNLGGGKIIKLHP